MAKDGTRNGREPRVYAPAYFSSQVFMQAGTQGRCSTCHMLVHSPGMPPTCGGVGGAWMRQLLQACTGAQKTSTHMSQHSYLQREARKRNAGAGARAHACVHVRKRACEHVHVVRVRTYEAL